MLIRVGVEGGRRTLLDRVKSLNAPVLVSANSLWNNRTKRFRKTDTLRGLDVALDSGGFMAMRRYGGYRWTVSQYVELAKHLSPTWWAQQDFCCEPEIATNRSMVFQRIDKTVDYLHENMSEARAQGMSMPMPVLQGWKPADYCEGPIYSWPESAWPSLVGVGSVCRRNVNEALHSKVPPHVQFHMFGVKSTALEKLTREFPGRIASMDSMAWNVAARRESWRAKEKRDKHKDAEVMATWYSRQVERTRAQRISDAQLLLFIGEQNER